MTTWPFQNVACFSVPYDRIFVAPRCSAAYCLWLLVALALFFVPLFAAFASSNFWVKEGTYYEQPVVTFAHELLVRAAGATPEDAVGWSSRAGLGALLPADVRAPIVRSAARDENGDGVADSWRLTLELPTGGNSSRGFRQVTLLAVYPFELRERVLMRLSGLLVLSLDAPYSASGVWTRGRLRLRQHQPLRVDDEVRNVYENSPLHVDPSSNWYAANAPLSLRGLLDRYAAQNETVIFDPAVPAVWDYKPRDRFLIEVIVDVPPQQVHYVPPALEVVKFAWVQYLSFLIPTWLILRCVMSYAFDHQLVETYVVPRLPAAHRCDVAT